MSRRFLTLAAAGAVLAACGDTTEPRVPATIVVDQQQVTLDVGETVTVEATVLDEQGDPFDTPPEGFAIQWTSSQADVAMVDDGRITGIRGGAATVQATGAGLSPAEVQVEVAPAFIADGTFDLPFVSSDDVYGGPAAEPTREVFAETSFDYTGHWAGNFSLAETFLLGDIGAVDYAVTFHDLDEGEPFTDMMAEQMRADGLIDFAWFWVAGHVAEPDARAAGGVLLIGIDPQTDQMEAFYNAVAGSMTHTSVTADRMTGTFDLELEYRPGESGAATASQALSEALADAVLQGMRPHVGRDVAARIPEVLRR